MDVVREQIRGVTVGRAARTAWMLICLCLSLLCALNVEATSGRHKQDLLSVNFPSEQKGWACGRWGTILHTTDGGKTWSPQTSGTTDMLTAVDFVNDQAGWVVGDKGTILATTDGGRNWVRQKSPVSILLLAVHFAGPHKGWAVGERTTILHTGDGGKTWNVQFKDVDYILRSVSFSDEQNGWACGEYGHIYRTTNGGTSWTKQAGKYGISQDTGEIEADDYLFQMKAIDARTAWAVGIDGLVTRTTDGGTTWKKVETGLPPTHLFAVDNQGGTIVIGGRAFLGSTSTAAGKVVSAKAVPSITYGWIMSVCSRGKAGFAAVGKTGWIYLSDDAGASWHRVEY